MKKVVVLVFLLFLTVVSYSQNMFNFSFKPKELKSIVAFNYKPIIVNDSLNIKLDSLTKRVNEIQLHLDSEKRIHNASSYIMIVGLLINSISLYNQNYDGVMFGSSIMISGMLLNMK